MRAFGEVLVENRKRKGYSQADLVEDVYKRQVNKFVLFFDEFVYQHSLCTDTVAFGFYTAI